MTAHDAITAIQKALSDDFPLPVPGSREDLYKNLAASINKLIQADFSRLVTILYRLDISETRLKQTLQDNPGADAGELIAGLIIERQLQKLESRAAFKRRDDIPDDEKW